MKAYSKKEWGITHIEYNRLCEALEQGILIPSIIESHLYELKNHLTTADELIRAFDHGNRFKSGYSQKRESIDLKEFEKIVTEILDGIKDVVDYTIFEKGVRIVFKSRSGKSKWGTYLFFDDNGKINGKYSYTQAFEGASLPWYVGNMIARKIKSALYE